MNDLREVLSLNAPGVQHIMQTIQEVRQTRSVTNALSVLIVPFFSQELQQQTDPDHLEQREALQNGLLRIHRETQYLPPMIDRMYNKLPIRNCHF